MEKGQKNGQSPCASYPSKEVLKSRQRILLHTSYRPEAVPVLEKHEASYEWGILLLWRRWQKSTTLLLLSLLMTFTLATSEFLLSHAYFSFYYPQNKLFFDHILTPINSKHSPKNYLHMQNPLPHLLFILQSPLGWVPYSSIHWKCSCHNPLESPVLPNPIITLLSWI